jgi:hypothetical protein
MLGHRFDEARRRRVVAERPAKRADALRKRFIRDRDPAPDLTKQPLLADQLSALSSQQQQCVKVSPTQLNYGPATPQDAVGWVEGEIAKAQDIS